MSLKPLKKSDRNKVWMKKRQDRPRLIQPEYHLIASEGVKTEPLYFNAIQKIINEKYRDRIQLKITGMGDNTTNLLEKAHRYVQNSGIVFKHVWIVYDTDNFPAEQINEVERLCDVTVCRKKRFIMQHGQTSALSCGIYCILPIQTPM